MKLAIATAAALLVATSASAIELGIAGLTVGTTTTAEYNVDAENMTLTLEPEVGYAFAGIDFTAGTEISIYNDDFVLGDEMPTLDFKAAKSIWDNLEVYGEVGFDLEAEERTDLTVGASFSF
jgi:hypothetical protein